MVTTRRVESFVLGRMLMLSRYPSAERIHASSSLCTNDPFQGRGGVTLALVEEVG